MDEARIQIAVRAAKNMGQTVAEWLRDAIDQRVAREREPANGEIFAPTPPGQPPSSVPALRPDTPPPDICRLIDAAVLFADHIDKMPRSLRAAITRRIRQEIDPRPDTAS